MSERKWMRFNYMDPIPLIDTITGKRTGRNILYLRAVRSDNYLYRVHLEVTDVDLLNDGAIQAVRIELRKILETFIDEVPDVHPMTVVDPYKGVDNWDEALTH